MNTTEQRARYEWHWRSLSLWRETPSGGSRVFTLRPDWLFRDVQNFVMVKLGRWPPDPFAVAYKWCKANNLWDHPSFVNYVICKRYANHCEAGRLLLLNPKLLK